MRKLLFGTGLGLLILMASVACSGDEALQANAGDDFSIGVGETPKLDGCDSTGDIVNYKWTIIETPDEMVADAGKVIREIDANCSYEFASAMNVKDVGAWVIELEVRDGDGKTSTDRVRIEVKQ